VLGNPSGMGRAVVAQVVSPRVCLGPSFSQDNGAAQPLLDGENQVATSPRAPHAVVKLF